MSGGIVIKFNLLPEIAAKLPEAVGMIVRKTAEYIAADAAQSMEGSKHGRAYKGDAITRSYKFGGRAFRKWKGSGAKVTFAGGRATVTTGYKIHRASAPGEAPAVDTGNLKGTINMEMTGKTTAIITADPEYARHLEFGTRRMQMRPFMRPAAEKNRGPFISALRSLERHLK